MREPHNDHIIEHQGLKSDPMLVLPYSPLTVDEVVEDPLLLEMLLMRLANSDADGSDKIRRDKRENSLYFSLLTLESLAISADSPTC